MILTMNSGCPSPMHARRTPSRVAALVAAMMALGGAAAHAQTDRYVAPGGVDAGGCDLPGNPCATIGFALDQSAAGDTIKVREGTYAEEIVVDSNVTIEGGYQAGFTRPMPVDPMTTVLDGQDAGRPVRATGTTTVATLDGFRVTNGDATSATTPRFGGGILVEGGATLTVNNCHVDGNVAASNGSSGFGGGLAALDGTLTLTDSTVADNTAKPVFAGQGRGGGIYGAGSLGVGRAHLNITDSTITGNNASTSTATGDALGGGVFIGGSDDSVLTMTRTTVSGNFARSAAAGGAPGLGGGVAADTTTQAIRVTITDCMILDNVANAAAGTDSADEAWGGGISLNANALGGGMFAVEATITGTTISGNRAKTGAGDADGVGGGINARNSMLTIERSTIANNVGATTAGDAVGGGIRLTGSPMIGDRLRILGNAARTASGTTTFQDGGGFFASGVGADVTLTNSFLADNTTSPSGGRGSQICVLYGGGVAETANLVQLTLAATATETAGAALYVETGAGTAVNAQNLVIHNHGLGIHHAGGAGTLTASDILFDGVSTQTMGTITGGGNFVAGDADFVDTPGDWHIDVLSDAIDAGATTAFTTDIDGESRVGVGTAFDLGADEFGGMNEPPSPAGIRPVLAVNVATESMDPEMDVVMYTYVWASDGGDTPVTQGPTTATNTFLFEGTGGATFDEGETWTVTVTPRDGAGTEGSPTIGTYIVGAGGEVTFLGFATR